MFILYCKDKSLQNSHGIPVEMFCEDVLELADILGHCGGVSCSLDQYVNEPQANWDLWTQNKIKESTFVVMVCSPMLIHHLSDGRRTEVDMHKGRFFSDTVVNCVCAPKFVPVFLNGCEPKSRPLTTWLPNQLRMATYFQLRNVRAFSTAVNPTEMDPAELVQRLIQYLTRPEYKTLAYFIRYLRKQPDIVPPEPPKELVPVPSPKNSPVPVRHGKKQL